MTHQRIILDTMTIDGAPGLPDALRGLDDASLADIAAAIDPCPAGYEGIGYLPIQPAAEVPENKVSVGLTVEMIGGQPTWVHTLEDMPLADRQAAMIAAINAKRDTILTVGAPVEHESTTLHVGLDDGTRADLTAMAATAIAAAAGSLPWPASYQTGWITTENIRIPLATPADGLALAAGVGDLYAQIVQHGRDLKDAVLAAEDHGGLDAIDIEAGWPS